eukprot:4757401-Prorocentrum_lima.AAC.1
MARGAKQQKRGKNWSEAEVIALTRSYFRISEDATTGTGQKRADFFNRIHSAFENSLGQPSMRTWEICMRKWYEISREVA